MVSEKIFRSTALSFPETTEEPHFERSSFRVRKKIFATFDQSSNTATLKLSEVDQHIFSAAPGEAIYPVPNKWGKNGWTHIELSKVNADLFQDALTTAYCEVAPKKLSQLMRKPSNNEY